MGLEDDIREIFRATLQAKEEERKRVAQCEEKWAGIRQKIVLPALQRAATGLGTSGLAATCRRNNGGAELLVGLQGDTDPREHLTFDIERKNPEVVACKSSKASVAQVYGEELTAEMVDEKIREFVRAIAPHYI